MGKLSKRFSEKGERVVSKTIWVDITNLMNDNRRHTGIQRVVYGIAKEYFLSKDKDVKYFYYTSALKKFYEADFKSIYLQIESARTKNANIDGTIGKMTLRSKLKMFARAYVPERIRRNAKLRDLAKKSYYLARDVARVSLSIVSKLKRGNASMLATGKIVNFKSNDTVIVLGSLLWDDHESHKLLLEQKAHRDFTLVECVYDLVINLYPHLHHNSLFNAYNRWLYYATKSADLLLCISENTRQDLYKFCERLNIPKPRAEVIRIGDELDAEQDDGVDYSTNLYDPGTFIICVGTLEIRKNHILLYQAYKLAAERGVELPKLIIIGGQGWLAEETIYLVNTDPDIHDKIIIRTDINDGQLKWLYENCLFTIYPSRYEGWGLPVAESLAYGKLCLSSSASSMPEIGGELVDYFSPYDTGECLNSIARAIKKDYRGRREIEINKNYKPTTWNDTYRQVKKSLQ